MNFDLVIKNGKIVTPSGVINGSIAVKGEKIAAITNENSIVEAKNIIDAEGKIVLPGGIDTHSHIELKFMGEQGPETWDEATIAAAIGGTTTTIDFVFQEENEFLFDSVKRQFSRAEELSDWQGWYDGNVWPVLSKGIAPPRWGSGCFVWRHRRPRQPYSLIWASPVQSPDRRRESKEPRYRFAAAQFRSSNDS